MSDFELSDGRSRVRLSPIGDLSWPLLATRIPGFARSSDEQRQERFDAVSWFEAAADEELVALAGRFFGYSPEASAVATFCAREHRGLEDLEAYARDLRQKGHPVEVEVELDVAASERWLEENRAHVIPWVKGEVAFATPHHQVKSYELHDEEGTPLGRTWDVYTDSSIEPVARFEEERGQTLDDAVGEARRLEAALYEIAPDLSL